MAKDVIECGVCGGDAHYMGSLGPLDWYRCRNCGMEQNRRSRRRTVAKRRTNPAAKFYRVKCYYWGRVVGMLPGLYRTSRVAALAARRWLDRPRNRHHVRELECRIIPAD
jgi:hypothetical protein